MRAAHAVAPNLAYPPQWHLPTTDVKPPARSKSAVAAAALLHAAVMLAAGAVSCPVASACAQQVLVWPDQAFLSGSVYGESTVY